MKHMLIAQSGGPSAAINATVAGVVERCMTSDKVDRIYGAVNGIKGVLNGNYVDLTEVLSSPEQLRLLCSTPAAALGSCRLKLNNADEGQLGQIVDALLSREIGYFVYIGGNDSMDTVYQLSAYIKKHNIQGLSVMGAPKTIDNDLPMIRRPYADELFNGMKKRQSDSSEERPSRKQHIRQKPKSRGRKMGL